MVKPIRDELKNAVDVIAAECASHKYTCQGCPFWIYDGTGSDWWRCGLGARRDGRTNYPREWAFDGVEDDILNINISKLGLSTRPYTVLHRVGIQTVGDILNTKPNELKKLRNMGKKSMAEIIDKLENGLGIDMSGYKEF